MRTARVMRRRASLGEIRQPELFKQCIGESIVLSSVKSQTFSHRGPAMKCSQRVGNAAYLGLLIPGLLMAALVLTTAVGVEAAGNYTVWAGCASGTNGNITKIITGGGICVGICSNNKTIISSSNGTSWSVAYTAADVPTDMVYNGSKFYCSAGSSFLTSTNGTDWISTTVQYAIGTITCGVNGEMVSGGYRSILCSNDYGVTWQPMNLGALQSAFGAFTYLPSKDQFVGMGSGGLIETINKSKIADSSGRFWFSCTPSGGTQTMYFSALNYNPSSATWYGIELDNIHDYWISASKDLAFWNHIDSGRGDINSFVFYNGMAFGIGSIMGKMPTVDTSGAWGHNDLSGSSVINDIAYGDSAYVAVGNNGAVFSSRNGTSWTACSSGTTQNLNKVIFVGGSGTPKRLAKTAFPGGGFIAVGTNGVIITANQGTTLINNRRIEHQQAGRAHDGRNVPQHAYSLNGRDLKMSSEIPPGYRPTAIQLRKQPGNGPSGLVVRH